ncbi:MAG: response regulator [Desulfobacteraceae bacterium]|nr:response regulator [Desulfobacteraceae bacterium]
MVFKQLKFRNKLLVAFLAAFVPLILIGSVLAYYQVKKTLETNIEKELTDTTESLINLIQISATISIKNRLQAIAEKNLEIAQYFYDKYKAGTMTREQAIKTIEEIFLTQSVGISGYIYCLDSNGLIVIHPKEKVKGENLSKFDFIKQQLSIKEGYLEYNWKNPGESHERAKALYMVYFEPLDWIISVSTYRDEFSYLVDINQFKESILAFKSGKTGYAFVMDETGMALIHPRLQGSNLLEQAEDTSPFVRQMLDQKNGKLRYFWKNPDENRLREKIVIFKNLPQFKWIVGSTSYVEEVFSPLKTFKTILAAVLIITLLSTVILTFFISRSITRPLDKLIQKLEAGSRGDFSVRMNYDSQDELGKLSRHFNSFMDRLEDYHEKLNNEIQKTIATQAALVENELKLRGLFNQSFQYTGIVSPYGILEEVNQSALDFADCTEAEVLYKPFWETLWWGHDPTGQEEIKEAIHKGLKGELVRMETTNKAKTGEIRNLDISIKPVFNNSNQIEFLIVEGRDITNLKQADAARRHLAVQLERSQKMEAIGTLAGGIAHDFNNILSSIFGYTQLAAMTIENPEKTKKHITQIIKGAQRAAGLVQQILTFSRQTEYKKHPLKIYLILKETLKLLRSSIPTTIEIKTQILSTAVVMADPTQMHQVIMNLCTNAYHSMPKTGGILTVRLEDIDRTTHRDQPVPLQPPYNYLKLEVLDTGCGMDQNTLEKAFDPYFTTKEVGRGTGFGLALVHAIVDEHDGIIHAESEPGIGTKFLIYLPIVEKDDKSTPQAPPPVDEPEGGNETIMVVDDDKDIRNLTRELLENIGYTAHSFQDGEKALAAFEENPDYFDLIITDMAMPRMTGYELAKRVLHIRSKMPIILCTGYSENITKHHAIEIGISRYLQKPLQNQDLLFIIREVLDGQEPVIH